MRHWVNSSRELNGVSVRHCTLHIEGTKPDVLCTKCSVIFRDEFAHVVFTE